MENKTQPKIIIPDCVAFPEIDKQSCDNGIELYYISNCQEMEVVRVSLLFRAGTRYQDKSFLASSTLSLLSEGSKNMSSQELSEKLDFYGSYYEVNVDRDFSVITVCSLSKFLKPTLEIIAETLNEASFPEQEIEIYKAKRKQQLRVEKGKVAFRARELFTEALFGKDHPYGAISSPEKYDEISRDNLVAFYERCYHSQNCRAICSGHIEKTELEIIKSFLNSLRSGDKVEDAKPKKSESSLYVYEEKKDALQSAIRVGCELFPRTHPDFPGMQILCTVLGGYFGSRLIENLREDKGYTYGVYSAMINMEHSGYMVIGTDVAAQFTEDAVNQILIETERLRTEEIPQNELDRVKSVIIGELMRILDGPFGIADVVIESLQCEFSENYVLKLFNEVQNITPEKLKKLAVQYLDTNKFTTVVVGKK